MGRSCSRLSLWRRPRRTLGPKLPNLVPSSGRLRTSLSPGASLYPIGQPGWPSTRASFLRPKFVPSIFLLSAFYFLISNFQFLVSIFPSPNFPRSAAHRWSHALAIRFLDWAAHDPTDRRSNTVSASSAPETLHPHSFPGAHSNISLSLDRPFSVIREGSDRVGKGYPAVSKPFTSNH